MTQAQSLRRAFGVPDLSAAALARVTEAVAATAAQYDRTGEIPVRALEAVHQAGLLAATVGTRYGGPGLGEDAVVRILRPTCRVGHRAADLRPPDPRRLTPAD